ncbi:MAG: ATP-binding protein [Steroidobacteraceae bacterium]
MDDRRVIIYPPSRRDGETTGALLQAAAILVTVCYSASSVSREIATGAGVLMLTDAALFQEDIDAILTALSNQPSWSDLPVVLLCQADNISAVSEIIARFTNVTLLDRPTSARSLVSAAQTGIRARMRQYQLRDQLDALRRAENALRTADRRKDEFLAMLAHELRNPLAPIRNASEFLTRALPQDAQMQATAGIVRRQVAQLSRLVDDLLDVSRITQGRVELQKAPVDLATIASQALESVEPIMRQKRHKVFVASNFSTLRVNGDSARLVQCVSNVLNNSAKYTDPGGEVRIELREEGKFGVIAVSDNGVGIPAELLPRIFDLFVQSPRSLDRSQGGLGIGLSLVRRLIDMHGGHVQARSDGPGRGAVFEMRLPLLPYCPTSESEAPTPALSRKRILIVDDNSDAADSLTMLLNLAGHAAEAVYTAGDALSRVNSTAFDAVLLDIGLPDMSGFEVASQIRAVNQVIIIVALTGYAQAEDISRSRAAGFDAHLAKPVDLQALMSTVGTLARPA